jgi:hypothetical protein
MVAMIMRSGCCSSLQRHKRKELVTTSEQLWGVFSMLVISVMCNQGRRSSFTRSRVHGCIAD